MVQTYVITLDRNTFEWEQLQTKIPWKLTPVSAVVDGDDPSECPFFINRATYQCILSHRKVWKMVAESEEPALVLEENCHPLDEFETSFQQLIKTLPPDFDVALVGHIGSDLNGDYMLSAFTSPFLKRRHMQKVNADWYIPGIFIGTHCYLLSPRGAKKLLSKTIKSPLHVIMNRDTNLVVYCSQKSIASQGKTGTIQYNPHISWEWLLMEPIVALGSLTIRMVHVILLYVFLVVLLAMSSNPFHRMFSRVLIVIPFLHYMGMKTHISHHQQYPKTSIVSHKKLTTYQKLNDTISSLVLIILLWIGISKNVLVPIVDILLVGKIIRAIIIEYVPLKDPSGMCEERSVDKISLFEYCGSLRVSGHIMSAVVLTYFMPTLGMFFIVLQTMLILLSKSHYPIDILLGIVVMVSVVWIFTKGFTLYRPSRS